MSISRMMKLSLVSADSGAEDIIKKLTWLRCAHITRTSADEENPDQAADAENRRLIYERDATALNTALMGLRNYREDKAGLFGRPIKATRADLDVDSERYGKAVGYSADYAALRAREAEISAERTRLRQQIESLKPWQNFDVSLDSRGTALTELTLGVLPPSSDIDVISAEIAAGCDSEFALLPVSREPGGVYVSVITMKDGGLAVTDELTRRGFAKLEFSSLLADINTQDGENNLPSLITDRAKAALEALDEEEESLSDKFKALAAHCREMELAYDAAMTRAAECASEKLVLKTEKTTVVTAWVPYLAVPAVKAGLDSDPAVWYTLSDPSEDDNVPVKLLNQPAVKPFESVVGLYSLPAYGSFDPTFIMSIFFFVIFGFMLGDVLYGLLLTVGCLIMLKLLNISAGVKNLVKLFAICGVSSIICGVLFGSYFGDLPQQLMKNMFGADIGGTHLWFDMVNDPILFLIVSMAIGVIHIMTGMGIKIYMSAKEGRLLDGILDVVPWYVFFVGLGLLGASSAFGISSAPGKAVAGAGAVFLILTQGRGEKNPIMKVLKGVMSLYDTVSYISDLLSYSRIMALGLASAVIAQVVNLFGTMGGNTVVGWLMFLLIIPLGHVVNLVINLLGTFVHDSRLQYIEFFGKFYEDGGTPFVPAAPVTKYTEITE
ncbi:MAG: V-type ATP synthase subunit I [Clostridiales bacterium]|nr:V-type ATP synthase subunit I [Clostridiales bacterium]